MTDIPLGPYIRGDTINILIESINYDSTGEPYILQDGDEVIMEIRVSRVYEKMSTGPLIFRAVLTNADYDEEGGLLISIKPEVTKNEPIGKYDYDIRLVMASGDVYTIVEHSPFIIEKNITEVSPDGA